LGGFWAITPERLGVQRANFASAYMWQGRTCWR